MPLFDRSALNPQVRPREVFAWSMYDFANSGYTTVILTAVFNAYFVGVLAANAGWATLAWTLTLALSSLLIMLTAPAIGAWADAHGAKKRLLAVSTVACVLSTAALAWAQPGLLWLAALLIIVSNYSFSIGETLNAAFLPELARPEAMGKVSGWGWSFGYFGGMLTLGLSLAWVMHAQGQGQAATDFVPVTALITAAVFGIASLPMFVMLRERARPRAAAPAAGAGVLASIGGSLSQLRRNWQAMDGFPDFSRLLWCAVSYQAGISVVIALAAIYAEQVMGFVQAQTMMLVFLVNIAAAVGAFGFGYVQDRIGHRPALAVTLVGWIVMVLLAGLGRSVALFWLAAVFAGLCMGSSQSAGRAMAGLFAPRSQAAEFFGLWAFATRLAAVIGPLTYGLVTWVSSGNHRVAILSTGVFFLVGLWLLRKIDPARGQATALRVDLPGSVVISR
ncbi:MAG: MFS transporter [Burkholderiaceae bacterium]